MIVLDTHVWVWWVSGVGELSPRAGELIAEAVIDRALHVSCISAWEVAMLVRRGRLVLTMGVEDWVARSEALPFLRFVPVDNRIALGAVRLPEPLHRDPADRIILSTAQTLGATLVTRDERLWDYPHVETAW
ncbi:MAG: type II toxin-antitoxin system VapC family toxin [Gemmatimonadota bacterium]|nr:MAG: type II toxin-antitoxin system VapC family toxin [Gemmatimonadota bacterium]